MHPYWFITNDKWTIQGRMFLGKLSEGIERDAVLLSPSKMVKTILKLKESGELVDVIDE